MSIQAGDQVIVYSSRDQIDSITVTPGQTLQSRYGSFKHDKMVDVAFGTKFPSSNGRGFVYLLKPTPELWTLALPHRTQILYLPDIAFITSYLDIKAGSKVIEAGTGSGSFSHALVRTVGKKGKVYSYEFHEERFNKARDEFKDHGLDDIILIKHQNVYRDGFESTDEVDSVFLDLPAPWEAIGHARAALRKDRQSRICCFSPCIEQVIRTVSALSEQGFSDITMYECLTRTHDPVPYTLPSIDTAIERIQGVEAKKERRREGQIADARRKREERERKRPREEGEPEAGVEGEPPAKRAENGEEELQEDPVENGEREGGSGSDEPEDVEMASASGSGPAAETKVNGTSTPGSNPTDSPIPVASTTTSQPKAGKGEGKGKGKGKPAPPPPAGPRLFTFKPTSTHLRGHTSFLTFATLLPSASTSTPAKGPTPPASAVVNEGSAGAATSVVENAEADETDEFPLSPGAREALLAMDESAYVATPV